MNYILSADNYFIESDKLTQHLYKSTKLSEIFASNFELDIRKHFMIVNDLFSDFLDKAVILIIQSEVFYGTITNENGYIMIDNVNLNHYLYNLPVKQFDLDVSFVE